MTIDSIKPDREGIAMTADSINPENVYALVVGIEKYNGESKWGLNGPARDALNFANWLLDRKVKPEHILLFLSPLDENSGVLEEARDKELSPKSAGRHEIDIAIREQLISKDVRGDILHVFWGGHGFVTTTDRTTRRLFFADTDNTNKLNLDFDSLVEALSTFDRGSGFKQQNFWIDACANIYSQELYATMGAETADSRFGRNGGQGKSEQFVFFAAAVYKVAMNDSAEGTGRFSRAVLDELRDKSLLPDVKALADRIQAKKQLEPVYFWSKGRGYEEVEDRLNVKAAVVTQKHQPLSEAQQLKLQYLQTKSESLQQKLQRVRLQIDAVLPADVLTKDALENQLNLLFNEIAEVHQSIEKLGQENG